MNIRMQYFVAALIAAAGLSVSPPPAQAGDPIPLLINCQGRLHDGDDLMNGTVKMTLRVYTNATAGAYLYEDSAEVEVQDGLYSTFLGDDTTSGDLLEALAAGEAYLEVTAGGTTFAPRERMVTVPYAVIAKAVVREGITEEMVSQGAVVERHLGKGSISSDKLAEGSVTPDKIPDGSITLNKLADVPWSTTGNPGQAGKILVLGTLDNTPVDLTVSGRRALRILPHVLTPSILGGHPANTIGNDAGGAVVAGGGTSDRPNQAQGDFVFIGSGEGNKASGAHAAIAGGWDNNATGNRSFIGGGRNNRANLPGGTIGGGYSNTVNETYATIGGGYNNLNEGYVGTIAGGWANVVTGSVATIAGGMQNRALGDASSVGGGFQNSVSGYGSRIGGGQNNNAAGAFSVIGGGTNNTTRGLGSVVLGGSENEALSDYAIAAGQGAVAMHPNTLVFADGQPGQFSSSAPNQMVIRARGGVGIGTSTPGEQLEVAGNIKAESVIAKSFVGDGSGLTGIESGLKPGSIGPEHLAAGFVLPANLIEGGALTKSVKLGGVLQGSLDAAVLAPGSVTASTIAQGSITADKFSPDALNAMKIAPGSITAAQLADGVIPAVPDLSGLADAIEESVSDTWKLGGNAGVQGGSQFLGTTDKSPFELRAGDIGALWMIPVEDGVGIAAGASVASVHKNSFVFSGDPNAPASTTRDGQVLLMAPNNVGINTNRPSEALTVRGNVMASGAFIGDGSRLTNLPIPDGLLTTGTDFAGDVTGPASNLEIRPGAIGNDHLSPELRSRMENIASQNMVAGMENKIKTAIASSEATVDQRIGESQSKSSAELLAQVDKKIGDSQAQSVAAVLVEVDKKVGDSQSQTATDLLAQVDQKIGDSQSQSAAALLAQVDQRIGQSTANMARPAAVLSEVEERLLEERRTSELKVDEKIAAAQKQMDELIVQVQEATSKGLLAEVDKRVGIVAQQAKGTGPELMAQVNNKLAGTENKLTGLVEAQIADVKKTAQGALDVAAQAEANSSKLRSDIDKQMAIQSASLEAENQGLLAGVDQKIADSKKDIETRVTQIAAQANATGPQLMSQIDGKIAEVKQTAKSAMDAAAQAELNANRLLTDVDKKMAIQKSSIDAETQGVLAGVDQRIADSQKEMEARVAQIAAQANATGPQLMAQVDGKIAEVKQTALSAMDAAAQAELNANRLLTDVDQKIAASQKDIEARVTQIAAQANATGPQLMAQLDGKLAEVKRTAQTAMDAAGQAELNANRLLSQVDKKIEINKASAQAETQSILNTVDGKIATSQRQMDELIVQVQQAGAVDIVQQVDSKIASATGPQLMSRIDQRIGQVQQVGAADLEKQIDSKIASATGPQLMARVDQRIAQKQTGADLTAKVDQKLAEIDTRLSTSQTASSRLINSMNGKISQNRKDVLSKIDEKVAASQSLLDERIIKVQQSGLEDILSQVDQKVAEGKIGMPSRTEILAEVDRRFAANKGSSAPEVLARVDERVTTATTRLNRDLLNTVDGKIKSAQDQMDERIIDVQTIAAGDILGKVDQKINTATANLPTSANILGQVDQRINAAESRLSQNVMAKVEQRVAAATTGVPDTQALLRQVDDRVARAVAAAAPNDLLGQVDVRINDAQVRSQQDILAQVDQRVAKATASMAVAPNLSQVSQQIALAQARTSQDVMAKVDAKIAALPAPSSAVSAGGPIKTDVIDFKDNLVIRGGGQPILAIDKNRNLLLPGIQVQSADTPNIILGNAANEMTAGIRGSSILGGGTAAKPNRVASDFGTIGGGQGNTVSGNSTTIAGGEGNEARGIASTVGGGILNRAAGQFTSVFGGSQNEADGKFASIGGGDRNKATGTASTVLGGSGNEARGDYSIAGGRNAKALHNGTIVLADGAGGALSSSAENQLIARASGGAYVFSSADGSSGVRLAPGGGSWDNLSDRNSKRDFEQVDGESVLEKVEAMPIYNYEYKTQNGIRHMGPVAQDFSQAFSLGHDDVRINSLDADGVALAAIQGLSTRLKARDAQVEELQAQVLVLAEALQTLMK